MNKTIFKTTLLLFVASIGCFSCTNSASAVTALSLKSINPTYPSFKKIKKLKLDRQAHLIPTNAFKAKKDLITSVYGQDDRVVVLNTTQTPWNNIAKLKIKFPDGKEFVGSGAAINSTHIITAAHNVFLKGSGGKADLNSISVYFEKYGAAKVTKIRILEEWTKDENWKLQNSKWQPLSHANDIALLTLDRPIENFTDSFELKTLDKSSLPNIKINISGYPDNPIVAWQNLQMKTSSGTIASVDNYQFFYNQTLDTQAGQSGSPLWYFDRDTNTYNIVGIHVKGNKWINGDFYNAATQITDDNLKLILSWVKEDQQNYQWQKFALLN